MNSTIDELSIRTQLEEELTWRFEEIMFFQKHCDLIIDEESQNKFRRALVVMLYSHFEGMCKFAFTLYVSQINLANIPCNQATLTLVAATLNDVFQTLRDGNGAPKEFKNIDFPDDVQLHRFMRERLFLENAKELMSRKIQLSEKVIDVESNLKPSVLKKILFRLGLEYDYINDLEGKIHELLKRRNKIAHGETKDGISREVYTNIRDSALLIMNRIIKEVTKAVAEKHYLVSS